MRTVGYFPYTAGPSVEAGWLRDGLGLDVRLAAGPSLNEGPLPPLAEVDAVAARFRDLPAVVAEGPGGFLWAAALRQVGFAGTVTVLPYLNPRRRHDLAAISAYASSARPGDRVFLGSTPSASVYAACGVAAEVGEPYGVDDTVFGPRPVERRGRMLLYAGRVQPDKDVHRLLRVALRARLLFDDLRVVVAGHVVDEGLAALAGDVELVRDPGRDGLAALYAAADVFVTASTSHFETFGRAPAEALVSGCPAVAPRYDGFTEVLDQPGGTLVDLDADGRVDEGALLRAVYDVLSGPPPDRALIAAAARRRFGRSTTIRLFDAPRPDRPVPPADLDLPAGLPADLDGVWAAGRHHPDDDHVVAAVRRALRGTACR